MRHAELSHSAKLKQTALAGEVRGAGEHCRKIYAVTSHMHYLEQSVVISNRTAKPCYCRQNIHRRKIVLKLCYIQHVMSKGLFAWLDLVWVGALMVSLCSDPY